MARDHAVERRHDKLLATIAEQIPDIARPLESAVDEPVGAPQTVPVLDAGIAGPVEH